MSVIIPPPGNEPVSPGARRAIIYLLLTPAVFAICGAVGLGLSLAQCGEDTECDLAGAAGLFFGLLGTLVVIPVVIAVSETVVRSRR